MPASDRGMHSLSVAMSTKLVHLNVVGDGSFVFRIVACRLATAISGVRHTSAYWTIYNYDVPHSLVL